MVTANRGRGLGAAPRGSRAPREAGSGALEGRVRRGAHAGPWRGASPEHQGTGASEPGLGHLVQPGSRFCVQLATEAAATRATHQFPSPLALGSLPSIPGAWEAAMAGARLRPARGELHWRPAPGQLSWPRAPPRPRLRDSGPQHPSPRHCGSPPTQPPACPGPG